MNRLLLLLVVVAGFIATEQVNAFLIHDIRLEGLQRISAGTVFNALPVSIDDEVNASELADAVRALFKIGYFQDIQMGRDGDVLVITVVERPSIREIKIEGNKAIKGEDLKKGLKQSGLAEGEVFQQATLDTIRLELERQYVAQGRYGASIKANVEPRPRNRVDITIDIKEGRVSAIKHINIVGNKVFSNEDLMGLFELKSSNWLSFYSNDDRYSREKLSGDLERLRSWYLDRGYINFNINSTQVAITPNKESVYITVNVDEGEMFSVNEVKLAGDLVVSEEQINALLLVKSGQTFSRKLIGTTENLINRRLGSEGYSFANVAGIPQPNEDGHTVDITFFVEPGRRTYVRRINFEGNTKTEDEVLRREMRQMEGATASTYKIEQSKLRLNRLGYFKDVASEIVPVAGTNDHVDVNYTVEEQPSGSITASIGYSQGDGLILGGSISQSNFLGTGNRVLLSANSSQYRNIYNFGFTDPFYTVDGVSRGFNIYYSETDYDETDVADYNVDTMGVDMTFGFPISETSALNFAVGVENSTIKEGDEPTWVVHEFLKSEGDEFTNVTGSLGWSESTLNHGLLPTRGHSQKISMEITLPGSDLLSYKLHYRGQYFYPMSSDYTLRFHTRMGYGDAYGSTNGLPFYENFYGGGFGSVRGYKDHTLGPRARHTASGDYNPVGGNVQVEGGMELLFPLPFFNDQRSMRTVIFLDFGNIFDFDCSNEKDPISGKDQVEMCTKPKIADLRYSAGVGMTWITPMGPLTFSLAKALNSKDDDDTQIFQFSLGAPF
ncbi:MAG: outer membrane protein assembly factor BamA [Endozoicomonadaceae bacterium]|nr:outer membrane protein assembly factor BamA [Endozoicomonadaceae bacterium]